MYASNGIFEEILFDYSLGKFIYLWKLLRMIDKKDLLKRKRSCVSILILMEKELSLLNTLIIVSILILMECQSFFLLLIRE